MRVDVCVHAAVYVDESLEALVTEPRSLVGIIHTSRL